VHDGQEDCQSSSTTSGYAAVAEGHALAPRLAGNKRQSQYVPPLRDLCQKGQPRHGQLDRYPSKKVQITAIFICPRASNTIAAPSMWCSTSAFVFRNLCCIGGRYQSGSKACSPLALSYSPPQHCGGQTCACRPGYPAWPASGAPCWPLSCPH
jgi:hypothetical protein